MDITVSEAARRLRISAIWARKLCFRQRIGRLVNPRLRLLGETDLVTLKQAVKEAPANRGKKSAFMS